MLNHQSVGDPTFVLLHPPIFALLSVFLARVRPERILLFRKRTRVTIDKCFAFASSAHLTYFSLQTLQFLFVGAQTYFFASGAVSNSDLFISSQNADEKKRY